MLAWGLGTLQAEHMPTPEKNTCAQLQLRSGIQYLHSLTIHGLWKSQRPGCSTSSSRSRTWGCPPGQPGQTNPVAIHRAGRLQPDSQNSGVEAWLRQNCKQKTRDKLGRLLHGPSPRPGDTISSFLCSFLRCPSYTAWAQLRPADNNPRLNSVNTWYFPKINRPHYNTPYYGRSQNGTTNLRKRPLVQAMSACYVYEKLTSIHALFDHAAWLIKHSGTGAAVFCNHLGERKIFSIILPLARS